MENINFVSNGKTGDLIHNLFVIKSLCQQINCRGNLYITNDTKYGGDIFHYGINKTHQDLKPLIEKQFYIDNFMVLDGHPPKNFINLNSWRVSPLFGKTCWIELLTDLYKIPVPKSNWLECDIIENDIVLIHRSTWRHTKRFPWETIIKNNKCKFITTDIKEYESFEYKNSVDLLLCDSFYDMVVHINSCKIFVGNMSTPLAIAHSLGVPHLCELYATDQVHYIGDEKYIKNFFYFKHNDSGYVDGLETFLKL